MLQHLLANDINELSFIFIQIYLSNPNTDCGQPNTLWHVKIWQIRQPGNVMNTLKNNDRLKISNIPADDDVSRRGIQFKKNTYAHRVVAILCVCE